MHTTGGMDTTLCYRWSKIRIRDISRALTGEHASILWEGARAGAPVLAERLGSQPKLLLIPYGSG